jgi:hypothetical protein
MSLLVLNGRFPAERATHFGVRLERVSGDHTSVTLRFGHELHPDYWQSIRIHVDLLAMFHAAIEECGENDNWQGPAEDPRLEKLAKLFEPYDGGFIADALFAAPDKDSADVAR